MVTPCAVRAVGATSHAPGRRTAKEAVGTVVVPDTGTAEIFNDILWAEGTEDLIAVHIGTSVADAVASASLIA